MTQPNVLFIMTDQQRFDTIAALGNSHIYTPNFDRLARRGVAFTNAYSTCPVCVPARYTVRTGCEPPTTRSFTNGRSKPLEGQAPTMEGRCGPYLARTMRNLGYRTFGIGKFHSQPWDEDLGYDVHLHSEEGYGTPDQRERDAYAAYLKREHPAYSHIEMRQGERTEMYYMPQASVFPAEATVEAWAADRAIEQIRLDDDRPWFGFLSFIGPHPPFAPPVPFNRMYDPDRMPSPVRGDAEIDLMDEQISWMNHAIWAGDISDERARVLKARYYGEISYIDECLGRVLDAVDASEDGDNTLICFFADHGDHLGDHRAWQKESFFEASCHVPFFVSWPERLDADTRRDDLVCLTDLFAIATRAGGMPEASSGRFDSREGYNVLGMLLGEEVPVRRAVYGIYGEMGTPLFKIMVRTGEWKYIYMANGGREQLFNVEEDPQELRQRMGDATEIAERLRLMAVQYLQARAGGRMALNDDGNLRAFDFAPRPLRRIYQFDSSIGVRGFPERPEDVLKDR